MPVLDEGFDFFFEIEAVAGGVSVVMVEVTILLFVPLIGIGIHPIRPLKDSFVSNFHENLLGLSIDGSVGVELAFRSP
ncbi:hypothetical protein PJP10_32525, partial [Mycobacterium kansasii]